ncbi:MAG TPA: ADP-ribosylglycohydrolase family protein [Anaerolineaceae bacterium]|jgi:ADP-ribosylglycohydrolase|nr:ADP-ribosylglycohydrolase family protein [Anaerolineaceae bacterium]
MSNLYDKVFGCLLAAAIGDAMGSPLETRPVYLIKKHYGNGNFVYDYMKPLDDTLGHGLPKGLVTDDFSVAYISGKHFIKNGGHITKQVASDALVDWKESEDTKVYYERWCGPTTGKSIAKLSGVKIDDPRDYMFCENRTATNGAGMKSWIAGLFNPGNIEKAIDDAITMCHVTHNNPIALSGGCAIAATVSKCLIKDVTLDEVVDAGLYGAHEGYNRTLRITRPSAGASVEQRIKLAVEIGLKYSNDFEKCILEMTDLIGTGLNANEAVPSAFGYLVAGGGDIMKTIYLAINSGNDCDTTAIMAGAMVGAFSGGSDIGPYHLKLLTETNPFMDIPDLAKKIVDLTI